LATDEYSNIWTKCNSLTQQFIGISTTIIDTWATCFDSYRVIFRPSKNTDPILQGSQVHCGIPSAYISSYRNNMESYIVPKIGSVFFEGLKMTR